MLSGGGSAVCGTDANNTRQCPVSMKKKAPTSIHIRKTPTRLLMPPICRGQVGEAKRSICIDMLSVSSLISAAQARTVQIFEQVVMKRYYGEAGLICSASRIRALVSRHASGTAGNEQVLHIGCVSERIRYQLPPGWTSSAFCHNFLVHGWLCSRMPRQSWSPVSLSVAESNSQAPRARGNQGWPASAPAS